MRHFTTDPALRAHHIALGEARRANDFYETYGQTYEQALNLLIAASGIHVKGGGAASDRSVLDRSDDVLVQRDT